MKISKVTIAVRSMSSMVPFYSKVLGLEFSEIPLDGFSLFTCIHEGVQVLLCPRDIAGITAEENTIQLEFEIKNLDEKVALAKKFRGSVISDIQEDDQCKTVALRDPDGNSLELREITF